MRVDCLENSAPHVVTSQRYWLCAVYERAGERASGRAVKQAGRQAIKAYQTCKSGVVRFLSSFVQKLIDKILFDELTKSWMAAIELRRGDKAR